MAEAVVSIVVGRLTDLLKEEGQLLDDLRGEIEGLVTMFMWMKTFLRDADNRITEFDIWNLVADIGEQAYDAEHVVESFLLKALSTKINKRKQANKCIVKIKDIKSKLSLLSNLFRDYKIKSTSDTPELSNSSSIKAGKLERFYSYTSVEPEIFVGYQEDVDCLVGHLVTESDDCYPLISICGLPGLGKTTLAQKIYHHSTIKTYFQGLAWVLIPQKWQIKLLLQRILICLIPYKKDDILAMDHDELVDDLKQIQRTKKCLIVLDSIWSMDAWDSLKHALTPKKSLSKLLLTSRKVEVARHVNPKGFIHQPECLSAEHSWELLKLKALPRGDYPEITRDIKKMEELGREMVGNCGGLPLAIVILGGILVTKPSLIEWEKVYHDSLLSLKTGRGLGEEYQRELFDVLRWSYNDLPHQLKPCFLYLAKFSDDKWMKTQTIYQLWIAEGIVLSDDKREGETMMQVAESYMGELVHKGLVQVRFNEVESSLTKFEFCSLHDLMRDLAQYLAKVEFFSALIDLRKGYDFNHNPSVDFRSGYSRQLVVCFDEGYESKTANSYFVKKTNQQWYRSLILINEFRTRSLPPVLLSHTANFRFLRVFSLEKVEFDRKSVRIKLGRVLGNLVYLRYLSVRKTNLLIFPSIQNLVLLQTLKLDTRHDIYFKPWLSRDILVRLGHLRHLYLPDLEVHRLRKNLKLRFDGLSKLETLENFNTYWCEVDDLPKLISLQKLSIKVGVYDVEEMMKNLAAVALQSSSCLRYLAVSIPLYDRALPNGPDILRQLLWDRNFNLQELEISGMIPELAELFEQQLREDHADVSLIRITRLRLVSSFLEEDPMPVLEKIPKLRKLYLMESCFMGKKIVCSAVGFLKLTILHLFNLPNLKKWKLKKGSMPILSELIISKCPQLEELPEGLRFLVSLRTLDLHSMPSAFCDRVRVINGGQGADFYKVAHVPTLILNN